MSSAFMHWCGLRPGGRTRHGLPKRPGGDPTTRFRPSDTAGGEARALGLQNLRVERLDLTDLRYEAAQGWEFTFSGTTRSWQLTVWESGRSRRRN